MKHISFNSSGKDSVAMTDLIIKKGLPLDEIVFVEVEKEFPQEAEFRNTLIKRYENMNIKCVVLKTEDTFDNWFYGKVSRGSAEGFKRGFPLTIFSCYWTREAKVKVIDKYLKSFDEEYKQYIGYAIDEKSTNRQKIIKRYKNGSGDPTHIYPLVDWNMQEIDCKEYCEKEEILNPLYKYFNRLGCFLCPKQGEESLKKLQKYFPEQWEELMFYVNETTKGSFIKPGEFNIKFNLEKLKQIENQITWDDILN